MNKYKAILFDMDGTLLPMEYSTFFKGYFKLILGALVPINGDDPKALYEGFMKGIRAMDAADGTRSNKETFWNVFGQYIKGNVEEYIPVADAFYYNGFEKMRECVGENPLAVTAVELARAHGRKVVLATNPVFPRHAQVARATWVGLSENDFDLITDYDSDSHTKPQKEYYLSICERIGVRPEECLMIGNDESDDMMGASAVGMDCFLVTDYLITCDTYKWEGERGTFEQLIDKLTVLNA